MAGDERILETRPPRPVLLLAAALAAGAAAGAAVWAYLEYAGPARTTPLALALAVASFAMAATVLLAFRACFAFRTIQGPRPGPPAPEEPVDLGGGSRRGFVAVIAGAASALVAIALLPLRALGPRPRAVLHATAWRKGVRLVTADRVALRAADLAPGSFTPVVPETAPDDPNSIAVLVRLRGSGEVRAYSRICTHAGCTVCIFRPDTAQLVCPCHHSTFDAEAGGRIVAGPASQALPELPIAVDADGMLVADGDFDRPVGPLVG